MEAEAPSDAVEAYAGLEKLLRVLSCRCELPIDDDEIACAAREAGDGAWTARLSIAAPMTGLRVHVVSGPAKRVLVGARPDLPVVFTEPGPTGPVWCVVDGWRLGRARVRRIGEPGGATWLRPGALGGGDLWARVEAALPAAPLRPSSGAKPTPMRRLLHLARLERRDISFVAIFAIANGVLALATPLAVQVLINWLAFGTLLQPIIVLSLALLVCLALAGALRALQRWLVEVLQRRIFVRVVTDISERVVRARAEAFDGRHGPELVNRFFDVLTVQKAAGVLLLDGLTAALQAAAGLTLLALYHPVLIVFNVVILMSMGLIFALGRGAQRTAIDESRVKYALAEWMEELARHPAVFRLGGHALAAERTDRLARSWLGSRQGHFRIFFRQYIGVQLIQVVVTASLLLLCSWLVLQGQLTLGQLVAAEFIVVAALYGFAKSCEKLDTLYDLLAGVDKLGTLADLPQAPRGGVVRAAPAGPARAELRRALHRRSAGDAFGPYDLVLEPGARACVIGGPGAGKSTIAELLAGLRPAAGGAVYRDGLDVSVLRPEQAWGDVLILSRDSIVRATVRDNLTLGHPIGDGALWEALADVGLADRVAALPKRLATELPADGGSFTWADARSLLVARARLLSPRLLIIDELFDGLESGEGRPLLDLVRRPEAPWTLVVLTCEASIASRFDRAFVLEPGGLIERPRLRPV